MICLLLVVYLHQGKELRSPFQFHCSIMQASLLTVYRFNWLDPPCREVCPNRRLFSHTPFRDAYLDFLRIQSRPSPPRHGMLLEHRNFWPKSKAKVLRTAARSAAGPRLPENGNLRNSRLLHNEVMSKTRYCVPNLSPISWPNLTVHWNIHRRRCLEAMGIYRTGAVSGGRLVPLARWWMFFGLFVGHLHPISSIWFCNHQDF